MPAAQQDVSAAIVEVVQITVEVLVLIVQVLYNCVLSLIALFVPKQPKPVKGEIVLITGAGHGIGKEVALKYASEGATVVIWDINEANAAKTVKEIAQLGHPKAHYFRCDVSNRENVKSVAKEVEKKVGDVTVLVNNAGIMPTHPLLDHTDEEIEKIININVMAHFWILKAFLPTMKKNNYGHIVTVSSCAGICGLPNLVPYCASKFAVRGMMEALHEELRTDIRNEIKLTVICPYMVDTGLCKNPFIRFKSLMPLVSPKDAATVIVDAQRKEEIEVTIPKYLHSLFRIGRLFPVKAQMQVMDFMACGVDSDLN